MEPETLLKVKNLLLDILFPKFCIGCDCEGEYLCSDCQGLIDINYYCYCSVCNCQVLDGRTCLKCRDKTALDGLFWAVDYRAPLIKKLFSRFKYESRVKNISEILAGFLIDSFQFSPAPLSSSVATTPASPTAPPCPAACGGAGCVLIPVPLGKRKLKSRGFNQSEEIAKHLAKAWNIRLLSDVLIKTRETISQTTLDKEERMENVREAFSINPKLFETPSRTHQNSLDGMPVLLGLKILLVDDVYTTGSTLNECARVLKHAGASQVWGITVARE